MKVFCFVCIYLFACFTNNAQESRADSCFATGNLVHAALYFEEQAFFESNLEKKSELLLRKSYCYKALGQFDEAISTLLRIRNTPNDSLNRSVGYEIILNNYLAGNYEESYKSILKQKLRAKGIHVELVYFEALNLLALNRWQEAKELVQLHSDLLSINEGELELLFEGKLEPKKVSKAFNLSMFLPGVGQMYAGYFGKGLFSGAVQAGLVGLSAYSLYNGYFFTGTFTGVAFFYTFYFGGARYAQELAMRSNELRSTELSRRLLGIKKKTLTEGL
ncbi:MAG: tetratricopeptide (TPR) repeat protein [Marinoscillum sp.]|jgi:tetratricopeptide (TPR) repeat protein